MADVRITEVKDIKFLYNKLKPADVEELKLLGYTPKQALNECFYHSQQCYTIVHKNNPIGIFGISRSQYSDTLNQEIAKIGLLTTVQIKNIKYQFIKEAKEYIKIMLKTYDYAYNIVSLKNEDAIKFLRMLDFKFLSLTQINNETFVLFKTEV